MENKTLQALETLSNILQQRMEDKHSSKTKHSPRVVNSTRHIVTPTPRVTQQIPAPTNWQIHVAPPDPSPTEPSRTNFRHKYYTRLNVAKHGANTIVDVDTGKSLEYRQLIRDSKHKLVWNNSMSNKIGRLAHRNSRVQRTNTMYFITYENIPMGEFWSKVCWERICSSSPKCTQNLLYENYN